MTNLEYREHIKLNAGVTSVNVILDIQGKLPTTRKSAVLYFRVLDAQGTSLDLSNQFVISTKYGPYCYIDYIEGKENYSYEVSIPSDGYSFEVGIANGAIKLPDQINLKVLQRRLPMNTEFNGVTEASPRQVDGVTMSYPVEPLQSYALSWKVKTDKPGSALFLISFYDMEDERLLPTGDFAVHPELGSYSYVGTDKPESIKILVPAGTATLSITGRQWNGANVKLIEKPILTKLNSDTESLFRIKEKWIEDLEQANNLLILQSTAGPMSKTNNLLLRSNRTALEMARNGWKVIYVPFGTPLDSDRIVNKNLIQISDSELIHFVDDLLEKRINGKKVYICSSFSNVTSISLQNRLQDDGWKTVYEIRDDMEEFRRVGYSKWYSPALELRFANESDAIVATSPRLCEKMKTVTGRQKVTYLPNAAPDELIASTSEMRSVGHFDEIRKQPIIGYLGHLTDSWFDWQKLLWVIHANPQLNFEIIGHGLPASIRLPMNVKFHGAMSHADCLPIVNRWTVGLIPFVESRLTYGVDPNKVYEYVAMGLQTVSSPMGDLENVPGVHIYRTTAEFNSALRDAVALKPDENFFMQCNEFLQTASWKYRVSEISNFIEGLYK